MFVLDTDLPKSTVRASKLLDRFDISPTVCPLCWLFPSSFDLAGGRTIGRGHHNGSCRKTEA